jgi:hypothetical protein
MRAASAPQLAFLCILFGREGGLYTVGRGGGVRSADRRISNDCREQTSSFCRWPSMPFIGKRSTRNHGLLDSHRSTTPIQRTTHA